MTWATDRRLDFIDWRLAVHGTVYRDDLIEAFAVSASQASADLAAFERAHPGAMRYDKTAKRYVPGREPYKARRGHDDPKVRRALSMLAEAGHGLGWE